MAIYRDPYYPYRLFVEELKHDEVMIKREYRDYYGALVKQHLRLHKRMIPGLIRDLKKFNSIDDAEDES